MTGFVEPDVDEDRWSSLARIGRLLHVREGDLQLTLDAVVATAVELIEPAAYASVNLVVKGRFVPQSALGAPPHALDEVQQRLGTGPCMTASTTQSTVWLPDTAGDDRWPEYSALARQLGVAAMVCVPLSVDAERLGSLSLYASQPDAFGDRDLRLAELLAVHAAIALSESQRTARLRAAAANRDVIGQAKGILMERHRIDATAAFELLSKVSQRANKRLVEVAEALIRGEETS